MTTTQGGTRSYPIPRKTYLRMLGTLHPSCVLPDDGLVPGDTLQLREQGRNRDTGRALAVTVVGVDRKKVGAGRGVCHVRVAVNTIRSS